MDVGLAAAAAVTGIFGIPLTLMQWEQMKRTKTNHGKKLGEHIEEIGDDVREARLMAAQIAADLATYKLAQARQHLADQLQIQHYVDEDQRAHAELKGLVEALTPE